MGGKKSREDLIPKKETKGAEALKSTVCDLKHEPAGEGESQLSILQLWATQGRETQQRAVRQNRGLEEAAALAADITGVAPVHSSGLRSRCALEFPGGCAGSDHKDSAQAAAGHRELGGPVELGDREEGQEAEMKPRDFPTGRAVHGGDEPVVIDMSLDGPEEAGANARSPSPTPNYEHEEEAQMMMDKAEADKVKIDSSNYMAPRSRSRSRERSPIRPVLNAYFTQNFRPKQVYGPTSVPQVTPTTPAERRKRKEDEVERRQTGGQGSSGSQDQDSSGSQAPGTCWKRRCRIRTSS